MHVLNKTKLMRLLALNHDCFGKESIINSCKNLIGLELVRLCTHS